jgi:hypothetical protein
MKVYVALETETSEQTMSLSMADLQLIYLRIS